MDKQKNKLCKLEEFMSSKIRGQDQVIPRICSVLKRGELGLCCQGRPRGSLLFLGPTGVGKTETALTFTKYIFEEDLLFRFDMSEFMHLDSVKEFRGENLGYVGRLGKVLSKHKRGTLLFDEMEKAHPQILDLFLQILDAARTTLTDGQTYDLSDFYIVFTSNIGSESIIHNEKVPFATMERTVLNQLTMELRPEFVARLSDRLVFQKLSYETQREIAKMTLDQEIGRLKKKGYHLTYNPEVLEFLIRKGIHRMHGARPLRNTVEREVQNALADALLKGHTGSGCLKLNKRKQYLFIES